MTHILKHVDFEAPDWGELAQGPQTWIGPNYHDAVLADGAVAYWRLGESAGPTAAEETGAYDATYTGSGLTFDENGALGGDADKAVRFSGTSDSRLLQAALKGWPDGRTDITIEMWLKFGTQTTPYYAGVVLNWAGGGKLLQVIVLNYSPDFGKVHFDVDHDGGRQPLTSTVALDDNAWHHVVAVFAGSEPKVYFYIDGQHNKSGPGGLGSPAYIAVGANADFAIGGMQNSNSQFQYDGVIDEVAIYPSALSAETIANHYNLGIDA